MLAQFDLHVPGFRSSELWHDTETTFQVPSPAPLDLILFNRFHRPWGAHVGVYVGDDSVLHLCREVGVPTVWRLGDFANRPRYRCVVGIKRPCA